MEEISEIIKTAGDKLYATSSTDSKDKNKAKDIRDKALKTWGKSQAGSSTPNDLSDSEEDNPEEFKPRRKRQRRGGSEAIKYLELKSVQDAELKKEEMLIRQQQLEFESKRLQLEKERQEKLEDQIKQQNELQKQQFLIMQQQVQQQVQMQTTAQNLMIAMLENIVKKD